MKCKIFTWFVFKSQLLGLLLHQRELVWLGLFGSSSVKGHLVKVILLPIPANAGRPGGCARGRGHCHRLGRVSSVDAICRLMVVKDHGGLGPGPDGGASHRVTGEG